MFTVLAILQVFIFGAQMAISVTKNQEPKLAAMEGNWKTQTCAPLYVVGWVDESARETYAIGVPCLLSFLSYGSFDAAVPGLEKFPEKNWAPVNLAFQAYHVMIDLGFLFPLVGVVAWFVWRRRRGERMPRWLLWACISTVFLAEVATIAGWWTAEVGRQPWLVWNVLRTEAGAHAGMDGPFTIFGYPAAAERDVVALDSAADALYLEEPGDVARYRRVFELLLPAALSPEESAELIARG